VGEHPCVRMGWAVDQGGLEGKPGKVITFEMEIDKINNKKNLKHNNLLSLIVCKPRNSTAVLRHRDTEEMMAVIAVCLHVCIHAEA